MPRKKLIVAATTSGQPLGEKVCRALTEVIRAEQAKFKPIYSIESWDVLGRDRMADITHIIETNKMSFGNSDGHFELWPMRCRPFASTEFKVELELSTRGADVFLIHHSFEPQRPAARFIHDLRAGMRDFATRPAGELLDPDQPAGRMLRQLLADWQAERTVSENDMELLHSVGTLRRDGAASRVTVFNPLLSNERQDHRRRREGIGVREYIHQVAQSGAQGLVCFDVHSMGTLSNSDSIHIDNIYPTELLIKAFRDDFPDYPDRFVIIAPDVGAVKKCDYFAEKMGLPVLAAIKRRDYSRANTVSEIILDVPKEYRKRSAIVIDDLADTCGTLERVIQKAVAGGIRDVVLMVTHFEANYHGLEEKDPVAQFDLLHHNGLLRKLYATDSVPRPDDFGDRHSWYEEVSIAPVIAETIFRIYFNEPVERVHLDM
jgi:ribose-phosphate pyrophosphokinase